MCLEDKQSQHPIWMFSSGEQCLLILGVVILSYGSFHPVGHHKKRCGCGGNVALILQGGAGP